jgi:flagellar biosynthetic protein FliR
MSFGADIVELAFAFGIASSRIGGFVLMSPFPGESVPQTVRVGLVVALAFAIAPGLPPEELHMNLGLAVRVAGEVAVGATIGVALRLLLASAEVIGGAIGQALGLGMPSVLNPTLGERDTPLGRIMSLYALLLAVNVGVHRTAIAYLLASFSVVRVGSLTVLPRALPVILELGEQALAIGTRLALPLLILSLAIQTAMSLLSRAAPSLQIFSIGFALLLLVGLTSLGTALPAIGRGLLASFERLPEVLERVLGAAATR